MVPYWLRISDFCINHPYFYEMDNHSNCPENPPFLYSAPRSFPILQVRYISNQTWHFIRLAVPIGVSTSLDILLSNLSFRFFFLWIFVHWFLFIKSTIGISQCHFTQLWRVQPCCGSWCGGLCLNWRSLGGNCLWSLSLSALEFLNDWNALKYLKMISYFDKLYL